MRMNGREVMKCGTRSLIESCNKCLADAGLSLSDIDYFIPHQANARIIEYAVAKIGLPADKLVMNVDRFGNTSAASIPIALAELMDSHKVKSGDIMAFVAFGAGLTWASTIIQMP